MADGPRFRPNREAGGADRGALGLVALLLLVSLGLLLRSWWSPSIPDGVLVEVSGEVPAPGLYRVDPPTVAAAIEAAGGEVHDVPDRTLFAGDGVLVAPDGVRVIPANDPLLVALPVDVNHNGVDAIAGVPGIGRGLAAAIVASREAEGPFYDLASLARVDGLDDRGIDRLRPFLTVGNVGSAPALDLNRASASMLDRLPGVGPVLAQRIIDDREARGPFASVDALARVRGVGPSLVAKIRDEVVVEPVE